jgi:ubiquinone/menaquinone biosynthesis C-methylase UbiE
MSGPAKIETPPWPTQFSQTMLAGLLREGDTAIDATAGNGYDTLFLANAVGASGRVLAFDVQEMAIEAARARIGKAGLGGRVAFFQESHGRMDAHAGDGSVAAVMFNLGYLPRGDHSLATGPDTIRALEISARLLKTGGALSVICYPGHPGGDDEAGRVEAWMTNLADDQWRVVKYGPIGALSPVPFLLFAAKGKA